MNRALTLALAVLLLSAAAQAAPAPFARAPKRQPVRLPQTCVMHHLGIPLDTQFRPDGHYEAYSAQHNTHWVGTWHLSYDREGRVFLHVCESLQPDGHPLKWCLEMSPCLRQSASSDVLRLSEH